jgi:hypothetical protein
MLELLFCSMLTIVPDYLFRRYAQGKRLGKEITFYSVWFELRWGITPLDPDSDPNHGDFLQPLSTRNVTLFLEPPIVPEINGRVAEVYVGARSYQQGAPLQADSSNRRRSESARRKI